MCRHLWRWNSNQKSMWFAFRSTTWWMHRPLLSGRKLLLQSGEWNEANNLFLRKGTWHQSGDSRKGSSHEFSTLDNNYFSIFECFSFPWYFYFCKHSNWEHCDSFIDVQRNKQRHWSRSRTAKNILWGESVVRVLYS